MAEEDSRGPRARLVRAKALCQRLEGALREYFDAEDAYNKATDPVESAKAGYVVREKRQAATEALRQATEAAQ